MDFNLYCFLTSQGNSKGRISISKLCSARPLRDLLSVTFWTQSLVISIEVRCSEWFCLWLCVFPSEEIHVCFCCWDIWTSSSWLLKCLDMAKFQVFCFKTSFPDFSLKSSAEFFKSYLWNWSNTCSRSS